MGAEREPGTFDGKAGREAELDLARSLTRAGRARPEPHAHRDAAARAAPGSHNAGGAPHQQTAHGAQEDEPSGRQCRRPPGARPRPARTGVAQQGCQRQRPGGGAGGKRPSSISTPAAAIAASRSRAARAIRRRPAQLGAQGPAVAGQQPPAKPVRALSGVRDSWVKGGAPPTRCSSACSGRRRARSTALAPGGPLTWQQPRRRATRATPGGGDPRPIRSPRARASAAGARVPEAEASARTFTGQLFCRRKVRYSSCR